MKCLIIAAGKGSRLRSQGDSKPLIPILGLPLIERVIRNAMEAGIDDFFVVTGYQEEGLCSFLSGLTGRLECGITTIFNEDWGKENGLSVLKAKEYLHEPFLLLMADHLFDPSIARELMTFALSDGEIVLGVDGETCNPSVDMDDVTRVKTKDGNLLNIGKDLVDFDAFDTGIFLCTPVIFSALEQNEKNSRDTTLSGAVKILAAEGKAKTFEINGRFWIDVDDPAAFSRAEKAILANLRDNPHDGAVSYYLNRALSVRISH